MSETELKPCPYCGAKAGLYQAEDGSWFIKCTNCNCGIETISRNEKEQLILLWNMHEEMCSQIAAKRKSEATENKNRNKIYMLLAKCKYQKHLETINGIPVKYGTARVEFRDNETFIESETETPTGCKKREQWAGELGTMATRLDMLGAKVEYGEFTNETN